MAILLGFGTQVRKRPGGVYASLSEMGEYHSQRPPTPLLDTINYPIHMKNLSIKVRPISSAFSISRKDFYLLVDEL